MAFDLDHTESLRQTWVWRKAPLVLAIAGVLLFLGGGIAEWIWTQSLRATTCTIVSAEKTGEIEVSGSGRLRRARRPRGQWVAQTRVEFLLDGVEPRRQAVLEGVGYDAGQVRSCWVSLSGRSVYFDTALDRAVSGVSNAINAGLMVFAGLVWHVWRQRAATTRAAG